MTSRGSLQPSRRRHAKHGASCVFGVTEASGAGSVRGGLGAARRWSTLDKRTHATTATISASQPPTLAPSPCLPAHFLSSGTDQSVADHPPRVRRDERSNAAAVVSTRTRSSRWCRQIHFEPAHSASRAARMALVRATRLPDRLAAWIPVAGSGQCSSLQRVECSNCPPLSLCTMLHDLRAEVVVACCRDSGQRTRGRRREAKNGPPVAGAVRVVDTNCRLAWRASA